MPVTPNMGYAIHVRYCGLAVLAFVIQFSLVATTFPLSEALSDVPLLHIDNAVHWYHIKLGANLASTGNIVGYDPFFAAGHLNGLQFNLSARIPTLLAAISPSDVDVVRLYKIYVFCAAVMAPLAVFGAAVALRLTPIEALIAAIFGILMWWVSYLHWYYTAGLVGYVTACYIAVLFVALIIRYLDSGGRRWVPIGLGLLGACGFFLHWALPVPVAIAVLAYLATNAAQLNWPRALAALALIATLSVLPNLFWVYAAYRYSGAPPPVAVGHQLVVDATLIGQELFGMLRGNAHGSKVYPLLFVASLVACSRREPRGNQRVWLAMLLAALALELLAYLGAVVPGIASIQPNRFAPVGYLLLCIPAARGLSLLCRLALEHSAVVWRAAAGAGLAAMFILGTVLIWEVWREVTPGPHGRYGAEPPEVRTLGDTSVWVIDWLTRRTTPDMRVLFETSNARIHDQAHMAGYYAYSTQREFIGGPYPLMLVTSSWDGFAFGKPITEISTERMAEYLSVYNIGAIIVHSEIAKRYFDAMPGVKRDAQHDKLSAYLVDGAHSYFLKGTGRVQERGHNHLLITDIEGSEVILKYHYVEGMVTDPPTVIEGIRLLDDPTPFVRIVDPPSRLRLYVR